MDFLAYFRYLVYLGRSFNDSVSWDAMRSAYGRADIKVDVTEIMPFEPLRSPPLPQCHALGCKEVIDDRNHAAEPSIAQTKGFDPTTPCLFRSSAINHPSHQTPFRHLFSVSTLYISTSSMSSCNASNVPYSSAADDSACGMFASASAKTDVLISSMRSMAAAISGCSRGNLQNRQCLLGGPER